MLYRLSLAAIFSLTFSLSWAEPPKSCPDGVSKHVREGLYDFIVTSRVQKDNQSDHAFLVTCVQNNSTGYFRFNWHIPGHRVDLNRPEAHENFRPIESNVVSRLEPGCLSYGNLNSSTKAQFHSDDTQRPEIEREKRDGCPKALAQAPTIRDSDSLDIRKIPRALKYFYDAIFFVVDPTVEKEVTRVRFDIDFSARGDNAYTTVVWRTEKRPSLDLAIGEVSLSPSVGGALSNQLSAEFAKNVNAKIIPVDFNRIDKFVLSFPISQQSRFGSAQMTLTNVKTRQVLSNFWIPIVYTSGQ